MILVTGDSQKSIDRQIEALIGSEHRAILITQSEGELDNAMYTLRPSNEDKTITEMLKSALRMRPEFVVFNDVEKLQAYDESFDVSYAIDMLDETGHGCIVGMKSKTTDTLFN